MFLSVQIIFAPREAGDFVAKIEISSNLIISDHPLQPSWYPLYTILRASAEYPSIQVSLSLNRLMFSG